MSIYRIIFFILFISIECAFGQKIQLEGKIISNGKPVPYASVQISNSNLGAIADDKGQFHLEGVPLGEYEIVVRSIGYIPYHESVQLINSSTFLEIELQQNNHEMDEVVVSANMKEVSKMESPVPVEVFTKAYFKANPTPSVFESLQTVNGVRPQLNCNVCNTGDIHINGLEGPYTMVLIDGMPIVSGLSTVYGLNGIPQSFIERIEIVKGPASTLYGSEAVGGLINVITKSPQNTSPITASSYATDWGEVNTDLGLSYSLVNKARILTGINYYYYNNPIDKNKDGFTDLTLQDRFSLFNKVSFIQKNHKPFSLAFRYLYEDRWGGDIKWDKTHRGGNEIYGESIFTNRWESSGLYQLPTKEIINLQFSMNGHYQNSVYGLTEFKAEQLISFIQLSWHKSINHHEILFGSAFRYTYYDDNTVVTSDVSGSTNAPYRQPLPSIFIQDDYKFNNNNRLMLGLRFDRSKNHDIISSPRLNYKWNSDDKLNIIRLSLGNGYRVANVFTEDHAALTGAREVVFKGELKPETSWNVNINLEKHIFPFDNVLLGIDMSAFYTYFKNRIIPNYELDPNKIIYANLDGNAVSKGISANVDLSVSSSFQANLGATFMDVTVNDNGNSYRQLLTESFQGVWKISYHHTASDFTIDYTGSVYGPMRLPLLSDLDPRAEYSPWWSIQNIQISKKIGDKWEVFGGAKNLLNFRPAANSIARAFDPFDKEVKFSHDGEVIPSEDNPYALTFDPTYVYAPNQGIRGFLGLRYELPLKD